MAFYFRKLGRSVRLVPAAKSLGYSTRINEGEKKEDGTWSRNQMHSQIIAGPQGGSVDLPVLSVVPLPIRDTALILSPRLDADVKNQGKENRPHPSDTSQPFANVAKRVPFTSDDILPEFLNPSPIEKSMILETKRIVFDLQFLDTDNNYSNFDKLVLRDTTYCHTLQSSVTQNEKFSEDSSKETVFETLSNKSSTLFSHSLSFCSSMEDKKKNSNKKAKNGPSAEQLHSLKGKVEGLVHMMFGSRYDYSLLHRDVILENNLFGENISRRGQTSYAFELMKLRIKIHARFSSTAMEVLNTTVNEESGVIRVHWRLKGLPQTEMLKFWRLFQTREQFSSDDWQWFEAFSYFHIGKDGLVYKHRIDRMLPGNDQPDKFSVKLRKLLNPAKPLVT